MSNLEYDEVKPKNKSLKVLLVTSEITYIKDNYADLFISLLKELNFHHEVNIEGLVLLRNFDFSLVQTTISLILIGCFGIAKNLFLNMLFMGLSLITGIKAKRERIADHFYIPIHVWMNLNDDDKIQWIKKEEIDIIVNLRTRLIYKKELLKAPKLGCINIHHGILPKYRGTMCDLYALSHGHDAGFSIHKMNTKIDDGEILHVEVVAPKNTIKDYPKYLELGAKREGKVLADLLKKIGKNKQMVKGTPNVCDDPFYSKTLKNPLMIRKIKKKGIKL